MALEHLLAAMEREARAKIEAARAEGEAEAGRIAAACGEGIARRRSETLAALETELRADSELRLAEARHRQQGELLVARAKMLEQVFAAARARFGEAIRSEAYVATLPARLAEALGFLEGEAAVVRCASELAPHLAGLVAGRPGVSVETDAGAAPGILVVSADGSVEVDNTLTGRLERLRPELSVEIVERVRGLG